MACCSAQEVCLVLPDTQGDDENHPAALVACKCQSKLAWESASSSCIRLGIHLLYIHVREQEGLLKVLSCPD